MASRNAMHGLLDARHLGSALDQLIEKSYRSRSGGQWRGGKLREPPAELLGGADPGAPDAAPRAIVGSGEDLAAAGVDDGEAGAPAGRLGDAAGERVQGADAYQGQAGAGGERLGARDADPQAGERAGADADRDSPDRAPAAGGLGGPLDLLEQTGRVPGAAVGRETEQGLVEDLAVARRADRGVLGRRVEADQRQVCETRLSRGR